MVAKKANKSVNGHQTVIPCQYHVLKLAEENGLLVEFGFVDCMPYREVNLGEGKL